MYIESGIKLFIYLFIYLYFIYLHIYIYKFDRGYYSITLVTNGFMALQPIIRLVGAGVALILMKLLDAVRVL